MNYILYSKNLNKSTLKEMNIIISENCKICENVKIYNGVCILGDSVVEEDCEIRQNSVIENSYIGKSNLVVSSYIENSKIDHGCTVGPFAHIHKNSEIGKHCRIGNFVEIKNSKLNDFTKVAHLSYVGDSFVGKNCNIGCGVVFCNYNGKIKQSCVLKDNVFVGSNVNLIAPVVVEEGGYIAAGSTINKNVNKNEFAIARSRQINKDNFLNPYLEK